MNKDPGRAYCLANPNCNRTGVREMQRLGWAIESHRKDGPKLEGGDTSKDGDMLTYDGQVLMSRPAEMEAQRAERVREVAALRSKAIGQRGGVDAITGPTGQAAYFAQDPSEFVERSRS